MGDRIQDLLIRTVEGALRILPEPAAVLLGGGLGWVAGGVMRIRRQVVVANLRRAFPEREPSWIARTASASYAHIGREGVALLRMGALGPEEVRERTRVEGIEHVEAPLAEGRGVILLTGHLGNWEIGGAALAVRGIPLDVVARRQNNPLFDARLVRTRESLGMRVVDRTGSAKTLLRSLRSGRVVALVADQNVLSGGVFVKFFGVPASTARGPELLAERTGAAVVFATAIRRRGRRARYDVVLSPLLPAGDEGAPDSSRRTEGLLRRYLAALEESIRAAPAQYLWAHKRWKTRPAEGTVLPEESREGTKELRFSGTVPVEEKPEPQQIDEDSPPGTSRQGDFP
ncbi:N/A [soil metagenome]